VIKGRGVKASPFFYPMYGDVDKVKIERALQLNEEVVYKHYLGYRPELNTKYFSPFTEENTPSFCFYNSNNRLKFKCFSTGIGGGCFDLISVMHNVSVREAMAKAFDDIYNNVRYNKLDIVRRDITRVSKSSVIEIITKEFSKEELDYWLSYGIEESDLKAFDVKSCKEVWINDKVWYRNKSDMCFRYMINGRYKVYRPNADKGDKWRSSTTIKDIQGFRFLPEKDDLLVITKSYKDIMVLRKHLDISSIALGSESANISQEMLDYFKTRFKKVILFYDNDDAGIKQAKKHSEKLNIPCIWIPKEYQSKDPSDLYRDEGSEIFFKVISKILVK
jgi:hypothetical protein